MGKRQMTVQEEKLNIDNIDGNPKSSNNNEAHINEAFQHEADPNTSSQSGEVGDANKTLESKGEDIKEESFRAVKNVIYLIYVILCICTLNVHLNYFTS